VLEVKSSGNDADERRVSHCRLIVGLDFLKKRMVSRNLQQAVVKNRGGKVHSVVARDFGNSRR
jgi:hypothetical protein